MNWILTIPKTTSWQDYLREIETVRDGSSVMNYGVRHFPKDMRPGDRCYLVWNGRVRGWMKIVNLHRADNFWQCSTTGIQWPPGNYIQRSGPFHPMDGPEMRGFQGVRRYHE